MPVIRTIKKKSEEEIKEKKDDSLDSLLEVKEEEEGPFDIFVKPPCFDNEMKNIIELNPEIEVKLEDDLFWNL